MVPEITRAFDNPIFKLEVRIENVARVMKAF
jgi:hypothetical protein